MTWTWTSLNPPVSRRKTHPLHVRYAGDSKRLSWQNYWSRCFSPSLSPFLSPLSPFHGEDFPPAFALRWIPFLMFFFSNSSRLEVVRAKIMRIVGKNSSWSALLPNFKKNQKRRSVSSQIRFDPFPHLRGHFGDARTSRMHNSAQITVRPAEPRRYDYRIVQLSVSSTVSLSL